jgi:hypothetical protein
VDPDVIGDVEGRGIDPQRPPEPRPRPVQQLPEPRDDDEPRLELAPDLLNPDPAVCLEQRGAVEDGERADVGRPSVVVPQHQEQV